MPVIKVPLVIHIRSGESKKTGSYPPQGGERRRMTDREQNERGWMGRRIVWETDRNEKNREIKGRQKSGSTLIDLIYPIKESCTPEWEICSEPNGELVKWKENEGLGSRARDQPELVRDGVTQDSMTWPDRSLDCTRGGGRDRKNQHDRNGEQCVSRTERQRDEAAKTAAWGQVVKNKMGGLTELRAEDQTRQLPDRVVTFCCLFLNLLSCVSYGNYGKMLLIGKQVVSFFLPHIWNQHGAFFACLINRRTLSVFLWDGMLQGKCRGGGDNSWSEEGQEEKEGVCVLAVSTVM